MGQSSGSTLPLRTLVIILILLVTATAVMLVFTGNFDTAISTVKAALGMTDRSFAAEQCKLQHRQKCTGDAYEDGSTAWADDAMVDDLTCTEWGNRGALEILPCGESYAGG